MKGFACVEVEKTFLRALELVQGADDVTRMIEARRGLFSYYYGRGEHSRARAQGDQVVALGEQRGDRAACTQGYWMRGCIASWQGDVRVAREELGKAIARYDPCEPRAKGLALQIDLGVNARSHQSWVLWILGRPDQAVQACDRAVATARDLAQPYALAMALYFACATYACRGEYPAVGQLLAELVTVTRDNGFKFFASCARLLKAQELIVGDQCLAGIEMVARGLAEFSAQEAGPGVPWALSIAATGYARLGRVEEGLATLVTAFAAMARNGERHWEAELWRLKGELLHMRGTVDCAEAQACLRAAIGIALNSGARALELRARTSQARLLDNSAGGAQALEELALTLREFTEGRDTADIRSACLILEKNNRTTWG